MSAVDHAQTEPEGGNRADQRSQPEQGGMLRETEHGPTGHHRTQAACHKAADLGVHRTVEAQAQTLIEAAPADHFFKIFLEPGYDAAPQGLTGDNSRKSLGG